MRTRWNSSNYGNNLRLTFEDAKLCSHSGDCSNEVEYVMSKRYVKRQLKDIDVIQLRKELSGYGAWSNEELLDHSENLMRWVWISAGDIVEGR